MRRGELSEFACELAHELAGLKISPAPDLIETCLTVLARSHGAESVWALLDHARADMQGALAAEIVAALAPRDTWFFRDRPAFDALNEILPRLFEDAPRPAIWCAGCATGQEAYSIAMLLSERGAQGGMMDADILATDLSGVALTQAKSGLFDHFEAQRGLSIRRLLAHFDKDGKGWRIRPALRAMVSFAGHNLARDAAPAGGFDLVLLRHVLRDTAPDYRAGMLRRVAKSVRPGGWLMLGAGETPLDVADELEIVSPTGLFRRRGPGGALLSAA